ncbi:unnamed protein product [Effrenium voratum]|nr:unnamed protein product [Effrenium voratum]
MALQQAATCPGALERYVPSPPLPQSKSEKYLAYQQQTRRVKRQRIYGYNEVQENTNWNLSEWEQHLQWSGHWIDSTCAKVIFYIALSLNVLLFALVATFHDVEAWRQGSSSVNSAVHWCYLGFELLFILIYCVELWLRWAASGLRGWNKLKGWCCYDIVLIVVAFVDACVLNFIPNAQVQAAHHIVLLLAPAFLILRLGRVVTELRMIIKGILRAMRKVFWAMMLLTLVIYLFSVFSVFYIGELFKEDSIRLELFGSMVEAMFTMFAFATLEDYTTPVRHFMRSGGSGLVVAACIVVFILFANLSLLNLVTAIMVESIVDILPKKRCEKLKREQAALVRKMTAMFSKLDDKDQNRELELGEMREAVNDPEVKEELRKLQIAEVDVDGCIDELFALINFTNSRGIQVEEFIDGLLRMSSAPASKRELLEVQCDIHKAWNMLGAGQDDLVHLLRGLKDLPLQLTCLTEEVRCMRDACRLCLTERDRLAQSLAQRLDAVLLEVQTSNQQADHWKLQAGAEPDTRLMETCLQEAQQRLFELAGTMETRMVQLLDDIHAQSATMGQTQHSLTACIDEFEMELQARSEKMQPEASKLMMSSETQTQPMSENSNDSKHASRHCEDTTIQASPSAMHSLPSLPNLSTVLGLHAALQDMHWSCPDMVGPPSNADFKVRVARVMQWVQKQQWLHLPFDKLILMKLEATGIQLSVAEQDLLKRLLMGTVIYPAW